MSQINTSSKDGATCVSNINFTHHDLVGVCLVLEQNRQQSQTAMTRLHCSAPLLVPHRCKFHALLNGMHATLSNGRSSLKFAAGSAELLHWNVLYAQP